MFFTTNDVPLNLIGLLALVPSLHSRCCSYIFFTQSSGTASSDVCTTSNNVCTASSDVCTGSNDVCTASSGVCTASSDVCLHVLVSPAKAVMMLSLTCDIFIICVLLCMCIEVFNLANWRFYGKLPNFKSSILYSDVI